MPSSKRATRRRRAAGARADQRFWCRVTRAAYRMALRGRGSFVVLPPGYRLEQLEPAAAQ